MKKFCLSLLLLMAASAMEVLAQSSLVATLNHNDTISVYYGIDALKSAYNDSRNGDVITLSSGVFDAPSSIGQNLTIRGAGMEQDSINKVAPTILKGDIYFYPLNASNYTLDGLVVEGIYHNGTIYMGAEIYSQAHEYYVENIQFVKCRLNFIRMGDDYRYDSYNTYYPYCNDASFVQCKISGSVDLRGNAIFINCYVNTSSQSGSAKYEFVNSVVDNIPSGFSKRSVFNNSVLMGDLLSSANMAYNCIGIYNVVYRDTTKNMFSYQIGNLNNVSFENYSEVFETYRGSYSDTETFKLADAIRTKHLGSDGNEVGMYGGSLPFNPQNSLPKIKKFNVASKSNAEGKLSVEIEVSAATE